MTLGWAFVAGYLAFVTLLSLALSAIFASVSSRFAHLPAGDAPRSQQGFLAEFLLGIGGWLSFALLFLAIILAPEARDLRLYGVVALTGAATVLAFGWKPLLRSGLERLKAIDDAERAAR